MVLYGLLKFEVFPILRASSHRLSGLTIGPALVTYLDLFRGLGLRKVDLVLYETSLVKILG